MTNMLGELVDSSSVRNLQVMDPKPPSFLLEHSFCQFTFPGLVLLASEWQRKALQIVFTFAITHLGRIKIVHRQVLILIRINLTLNKLQSSSIGKAFCIPNSKPRSHFMNKNITVIVGQPLEVRGTPRYLKGKEPIRRRSSWVILAFKLVGTPARYKADFEALTQTPETIAKVLSPCQRRLADCKSPQRRS